MKRRTQLIITVTALLIMVRISTAQQPKDIRHVVVAAKDGQFHGWPANNGVWQWGDEILVGFTQGDFIIRNGHNISETHRSYLARSLDGGRSWKFWDPENFVGDNRKKSVIKSPVDFTAPGFVMRITSSQYHGNDDPEGGFFYSYDKGASWNGPYALGNIAGHKEFEGEILTPRTDYMVLGKQDCLIFISSQIPDTRMSDKISVMRTQNGGKTFEFMSRIVPSSDPHRAVMPQSIRTSGNRIVTAVRRRNVSSSDNCWIDAWESRDLGKSWSFLSRVGETGKGNGNPPALIQLEDGRLCCIYGNRTNKQVLGRYSNDGGKTWGETFVVREGYDSGFDDEDLGYCRLVQRPNGKLVAMYYWASKEHPQQHIASSTWTP